MSRSSKTARRQDGGRTIDRPAFPARTPGLALLPLGALAAGFGLCGFPAWADEPVSAKVAEEAKAASGRSDPQATSANALVADADALLPGVTVTGRKEGDANSVRATSTTVGKGNQEIRDVPQSITVLTEKVLDDLKLNSLKDALHYTAGITFASAENGSDQDIRLRGFSLATTGDVLIDSLRDPSTYERDTFNYERIEVLRGAASMLFGRGSTGGVVNQVSKRPELIDQSDVIGSIGSRGYWRTTIDTNTRLSETTAFRLNAMDSKSNNAGPKGDKHGIAPSYRFGIGTADDFTVSAFYLNVNNVPQNTFRWLNSGPGTQGKVAPLDPSAFYGTESDFQKGKAQYGTVIHTHTFDDEGTLTTRLRSGVYDRSQWQTTAGVGPAPAANPTLATFSNINDDTVLTRNAPAPRKDRYVDTYFQSDYANTYSLFGLRNDVLAGIDLAKEQARRQQNNGFLNPLSARPNVRVGQKDNGAILPTSPLFRDSSAYENRAEGAYVQDLINVTPWLKLVGGVRYDHFTGDFKNYTYSNTTGLLTSTTNVSLSNNPWSYRGGILLQPSDTASFHFSYGTSFNTSGDTYQFVTAATANTDPEKSRNIEVGAKLDWLDNRLSTRMAIFRTEKYNERTTDADFATSSFLLSGKRHTDGVELDIVGRVTKQFELYVSASYIPTAVIDQIGSTQAAVVGQRVGLTPRLTASIYANYEFNDKLRAGIGLRGASKNYPLQGTTGAAQSTVVAPGYGAIDLVAEYKFTPDLFTQLNVTNLKNRAYGDQLYQGFYVVGSPRLVQLSLGARF